LVYDIKILCCKSYVTITACTSKTFQNRTWTTGIEYFYLGPLRTFSSVKNSNDSFSVKFDQIKCVFYFFSWKQCKAGTASCFRARITSRSSNCRQIWQIKVVINRKYALLVGSTGAARFKDRSSIVLKAEVYLSPRHTNTIIFNFDNQCRSFIR
jgi:hypothetical protein